MPEKQIPPFLFCWQCFPFVFSALVFHVAASSAMVRSTGECDEISGPQISAQRRITWRLLRTKPWSHVPGLCDSVSLGYALVYRWCWHCWSGDHTPGHADLDHLPLAVAGVSSEVWRGPLTPLSATWTEIPRAAWITSPQTFIVTQQEM